MSVVQPMMISGLEVWPLVEGGKGVAVSSGRSAGAWAGGRRRRHLLRRQPRRRSTRMASTSRWSIAAATGSSGTRS